MTKVTAIKRIVTVPEMIEAIKEHYNLNDTLLAINLNISKQTVKAWKEGKKPRKDSYLELTELYKGINSEEQTEEAQETTEVTEETEEKKPYKISYPDNETEVYCIDDYYGDIVRRKYDAFNEYCKHLYDTGLYFDTKEEAEQFIKEQTLIKKIKCWAKEQQGNWKPDWKNDEAFYEVQFNRFPRHFDEDVLVINGIDEFVSISTLPYFKNYKIAQACIDEFGDEILEVFC